MLIDEEMGRVEKYGDWKAAWWRDQVALRSTTKVLVSDGLKAYAARQAAMETDIRTVFSRKWAAVRITARPVIQRVWRAGGFPLTLEDDSIDSDMSGIEVIELDLGALGLEDDEDELAYGSDYEE